MPPPADRPPIAGAPLSLVLPVPAASGELDKGLNRWTAFLDSLHRDYEVLLIGGPETAARPPRVRVLAGGPGFGAALRIGLASARFPLLAHATADRCYRPGDLQRLLDEIDQVDLVSGFRASQPVPLLLRGVGAVIRRLSRWLAGLPLEPLPGWLGWQGQAYGWLVRLLFGVRVRDVQSELKLFRREIFTRLPIQCDGPAVHAEVLAKANFLGCLMAEVPVSYRPGQPPPPPWRAIVPELRRLLATPEFRPAAGGGPANETSGSQLGGNTNVG